MIEHKLTENDFSARIRGTAIGYLFLYLNFNLSLSADFSLPILPEVIGWFMLYRILLALAPMQRTLALLQLPCILLGVFSITQFFPSLLLSQAIWMTSLSLIFILLRLYFNYQFLSDIATLLCEYHATEESEQVCFYRSLLTAGTTALYCTTLLPQNWNSVVEGASVLLLLFLLLCAICLVRILFSAAKAIT